MAENTVFDHLYDPDLERALTGWSEPIIAEALAAGMSAEDAANRISEFVDAAPFSTYANKVFHTFGGGSHFKELFLKQALGLQPDDVLPDEVKGQMARSATDAMALALAGWHWNGIKAHTHPEELAARKAALEHPPVEYGAIEPNLRAYAILTGLLPIGPLPFGYKPASLADFRDRDLQSWLDLQWALREGRPPVTVGPGRNPR